MRMMDISKRDEGRRGGRARAPDQVEIKLLLLVVVGVKSKDVKKK